jgi:HAD superfamily hydrolase (TIGR01509 family)
MFQAVIFDWDGTLADTRKVIVDSFQKTLLEADLSVSNEYIERRIGIGAAETFREIIRSANRQVDEDLVNRLVERKSQLEIELTSQVKIFPGAIALLEALYGKANMGLASMNNSFVIMHMVHSFNLARFFKVVLTAECIAHSKPNPEIFLKTAQKLDAKPSQCVVLEDSIFGVKAAKTGDMACIGFTTGVYNSQELERQGADLVVSSLNDKRVLYFIQSSDRHLL